METRRLDTIAREIEAGEPRLGAETECIVVDGETFEVQHGLNGQQPVAACKKRIKAALRESRALRDEPDRVLSYIVPDVTALTIEANPPPLAHPRSTAAAQRLMAIMIDRAIQTLSKQNGRLLHTLHGAALRPSKVTPADISQDAPFDRAAYYQYQIGRNGDKVADAMGDHYNLSAPWLKNHISERDYSGKMVEMAGLMRLLGSPLDMGLTACSPFYYAANGSSDKPREGTVLTPYESARLFLVWRGRTDMDVSTLWSSLGDFEDTMSGWARDGTLSSSRAIWLPVRAQAAPVQTKSFGDLHLAESDAIRDRLLASFTYGPESPENPFQGDALWQRIEQWRQEHLMALIHAPKNRVEVRVGETPFAFNETDSQARLTPYTYIKALHTFYELLFIWLSERPRFINGLKYDEQNLSRCKQNEEAVLMRGLDANIRWMPGRSELSARQALKIVLSELKELAHAFGRLEDFALLEAIANNQTMTPVERVRSEVHEHYRLPSQRTASRFLPNDSYPQMLLERTRQGMDLEIEEIEKDLGGLPPQDQSYIRYLLDLVKSLNHNEHGQS